MASDDVIVRLDKIVFSYARRPPLFCEFDLAVRRGDHLGVIGANGSGKTTLFHLIVGLVKPQAGRLWVAGREISGNGDYPFARRKAGLLFQDSEDQLFCPTVEEDVAFGPLNQGLSKEQALDTVTRTLRSLGLEGYETRLSYQLSGGEKRLVALATVLAMGPEVLLLDEPASGLDPQAKRDLVSLLAKIDCTQVVASHDLEFIRATCTRVVTIDKGKLLADGPTDEVLGDEELMLAHGLEVPFSLDSVHGAALPHDHRHGLGPSHGHGHKAFHRAAEHKADTDAPPDEEGSAGF